MERRRNFQDRSLLFHSAQTLPGRPKMPEDGRARRSVEVALKALPALGPEHAVKVETLRLLADAIDADPSNASLWREFRAAEEAIHDRTDEGDEFAAALRSLSAEVGDSSV